jgi:hypothetical protein
MGVDHVLHLEKKHVYIFNKSAISYQALLAFWKTGINRFHLRREKIPF